MTVPGEEQTDVGVEERGREEGEGETKIRSKQTFSPVHLCNVN